MEESIRIEDELRYVDLQVTGSMSAADLRSQATRVTKMAMDAGLRRILVDNSGLEAVPSTSVLYELVGGLPRNFRYAIVAPVELLAAEGMRFVETAGMNTGLAVRIFETRETALEWLLA